MTGSGFAEAYGVELLYETPPSIDSESALEALRGACGEVEALAIAATPGSLGFQFPAHRLTGKEGPSPARLLMALTEKPVARKARAAALTQSWEWPEAPAAQARARSTLVVTDLASSGLPYKERLELFQAALGAILELWDPLAIHWVPSGKFVDPGAYRRSQEPGIDHDPLLGAVNVRVFRGTGEASLEFLMDTLGLSALGLRDFQCRVSGLGGEAVARVLHNTARYVFERGDLLEDGHTVPGIDPEEPWVCQAGTALVPPLRRVIDLDPGGVRGMPPSRATRPSPPAGSSGTQAPP